MLNIGGWRAVTVRNSSDTLVDSRARGLAAGAPCLSLTRAAEARPREPSISTGQYCCSGSVYTSLRGIVRPYVGIVRQCMPVQHGVTSVR